MELEQFKDWTEQYMENIFESLKNCIGFVDHIDALLLAMQKGKIGSNYCIGGNNEKTNIEIATSICELLNKKLPSNESYGNLINVFLFIKIYVFFCYTNYISKICVLF